ncbi:hypothetical protein PACTADRAFT_18432 [Pachysolen tannophilus NRRL Y-2460]|uniref:Uncharacterized protein n=1 Tax=Pachysolen tannophilus NRRL Y-2460 TaxID=669874 RepID=A0A1E4TQ05_PACTA|nr:hypothetical protein PACTADRAFT_18432 [Pachysolen tannophilus NRRL Y-2460]
MVPRIGIIFSRCYSSTAFNSGIVAKAEVPETLLFTINKKILSQPKIVPNLINRLKTEFGNTELDEVIDSKTLNHVFGNNQYKINLFRYYNSLELDRDKFHDLNRLIEDVVINILDEPEIDNETKLKRIYQYFYLLNALKPQSVGKVPKLFFNVKTLNRIIEITPRHFYKHLFLKLLNINLVISESSPLNKLIYELRTGTNEEQFLWQNASLDFSAPMNTELILHNYSYHMLFHLIAFCIKQDNNEKLKEYIEITFQKISKEFDLIKRNQLFNKLYDLLMMHSLNQYGLYSSVFILNDMKQQNIPINHKILMIILTHLRKQNDIINFTKMFNQILKIFKIKNNGKIDGITLKILTNEMLTLLRNSKFSLLDSKIILSYSLAFYEKGQLLLENLGILPLLLENKIENKLTNTRLIDSIEKASVNELIAKKMLYPSAESLTELYKSIFNYLNFNNLNSDKILINLYYKLKELTIYIQDLEKKKKENQNQIDLNDSTLKYHPLSSSKLDDRVISVFLAEAIFQLKNYDLAEFIFDDFLKCEKINLRFTSSYAFDLIIHTQSYKNLSNSLRWFSLLNERNLKLSFWSVIGIIIRLYKTDHSLESKNFFKKLTNDIIKTDITKDSKDYINHHQLIEIIIRENWNIEKFPISQSSNEEVELAHDFLELENDNPDADFSNLENQVDEKFHNDMDMGLNHIMNNTPNEVKNSNTKPENVPEQILIFDKNLDPDISNENKETLKTEKNHNIQVKDSPKDELARISQLSKEDIVASLLEVIESSDVQLYKNV